jgi:FKBP-type peptidyl-prolyl cis-trans isomerase
LEKDQEISVNSDFQIIDLTTGQGEPAQHGDTVQVTYTGWLYENGNRTSQFDSSAGRPPFQMTIGVSRVIRGWTEGLIGMRVGGKRELIIPPDLGYGERGVPPVIPPGATLSFEIEMLNLTKAKR